MKNYCEMKTLFEKANKSFLKEEQNLFDTQVSERTLCGALMLHLHDLVKNDTSYEGYFCDVEYNRNAGRVKTILNNKLEVISICCDLIVHSRGIHREQDNLIAIEMKKHNRKESEKEKDRQRLIALTKNSYDGFWSFDGRELPKHVCRYALGVYYEINFRNKHVLIEYYKNGKLKETQNLGIDQ